MLKTVVCLAQLDLLAVISGIPRRRRSRSTQAFTPCEKNWLRFLSVRQPDWRLSDLA